ncbi:ABC transporter ATP-binding protein [Phytomonospora endophytica]|uniref:Branched-chain amino acid transport system ATP-binding protein n=1 Tax=Phytomonospora endophytica TaxID=714109 RepID=A0A841FZC5_9ACTN|nr:ABC transporter ATP-binding protein [Phytomonospora endophytica]MBB6037290.1 branched-chain amino acid transport system ATP-binding protein [Phytomonospora endophytica]GIG69966.1 ABC transporter ATP-binding protein [Phytomonospora endophytica]
MRLETTGLRAGYHGGTVLHGVDITVASGEVHALVGHNGAGKTTLVHALAGLVPATGGRVLLDGDDVTRHPTHRRARRGLALVPQGRRVFASLTVAEHLTLVKASGPWTPARVLDLFPQLAQRRGHRGAHLSGGEQQMLAFARALLAQPAVLLLDEPTEGLVPALAKQIAETVASVRDEGTAVLVTAPSLDSATSTADRVTVLTGGKTGVSADGDTVRADPGVIVAALALHGEATPTE